MKWGVIDDVGNSLIKILPFLFYSILLFNSSISLISSLRENGQIINETSEYVSIKAYPGKNPNKVKKSEDITH